MKDKPYIIKGDKGWQVELPPFGFQPGIVKDGFDSQKDAFNWLTKNKNLGTSGSLTERAGNPENCRYSNPWPLTIR